jgi:hypothetical protein
VTPAFHFSSFEMGTEAKKPTDARADLPQLRPDCVKKRKREFFPLFFFFFLSRGHGRRALRT